MPGSTTVYSENSEKTAFEEARQATNRGALELYKKSEGALPGTPEATAAEVRFRTLPLLLNPALLQLSRRAIEDARGRVITSSEPFPATIWKGGATDTHDGRNFLGNLAQFVRLLQDRAQALAPKRSGWVVTPTTNTDGHRVNASTAAMHALNLDCDERGAWNQLLTALTDLNYAYVAYQSGGWTPTSPKWHLLLPLSTPFDTSSPEKQAIWKLVYNQARVAFGAVGGLLGDGFDPTVETPCIPIFITERRVETDPPRQIVWQPGHTLDLVALMLALPAIAVPVAREAGLRTATTVDLDDDRLEQIITKLCVPMAKITNTRRDLYLALAGVLCDRGVAEDAVAIIEEISIRCPGEQDRHGEHVHNARTTVAKFEAQGTYTRIGTLNERWPEVTAVLDEVLPDLAAKAIADTVAQMLSDSPPVYDTTTSTPSPTPLKRRHKLTPLGREVSPLVSRLKASKKDLNRLSGLLLQCFLDGNPLPTTTSTTTIQVDELVATAMRALGRYLPVKTQWTEALDFASRSLLSMDFTQSVARVAAAERAFFEGQAKRHKSNKKKEAVVSDFKARERSFFNAAKTEKSR